LAHDRRIQANWPLFLGASLVLFVPPVHGAEPEKIPLILDTDIGSALDDTFALALALASPELDLRGVTTVGSDPRTRALMVCRFLTAAGRRDIPVAVGALPQPTEEIGGQSQYQHHPAVIFKRTSQPIQDSAVDFLYQQLKAQPGKLTLVALGPLTNIARLLAGHPDCKPWIRRLVIMGGSLRVDYDGKPSPVAEWNIKCDIPAARAVFAAGIPLVVAPLDATVGLKLEEPWRRQLFRAGTALTYQLQALYQMDHEANPTLFDPVAVALAFTERFCQMENLALEVDEHGFTRIGKGKPNARVATSHRGQEFLKWYVERVAAAGRPVPAPAPGNLSAPVPRGNLPRRVHAIEDFETDIEKRWWMSGKLETVNVPPNSRRACRGILTQDFDDRMGDLRTMYTAVIFNPVPGPRMGQNTRLSFRYWLKGADTLRVQIYSLTRGFHRYLSVKGLPQERWQEMTVDMTAARRPDGSGGPLAENERIDDIQFYADPTAELLIDDIILYEAAVASETRPFPQAPLFTGWFDTGRQGKEWPGTFHIVDRMPAGSGKAAQSVPNPQLGRPWIQLHLRGERALGETTHLSFHYRLSGADTLQVHLVNRTVRDHHVIDLKNLAKDSWAEATVDFTTASRRSDGSDGKPRKGDRVDEIWWVLPADGQLLIEDLLLYSLVR
jgi:inosine-uridine nucleoside N-ribohydrolase